MNNAYIYVVGKPDPTSSIVEAIHQLGYGAGLLLDSQVTTKHAEAFDRVVRVDFSSIESELERLDALDLQVAGLQCTYENYVIAKSKLGQHFNIPSSSLESASQSTDKHLMRRAFELKDPTITPTFQIIDTVDQALSFANDTGYPLIIKPTNLVKSLLVMRCNSESELIENFTYAKKEIAGLYAKYNIYDREPRLIIEEYVIGKTCSIAAFVDDAGVAHFCDGIAALSSAQDRNIDDNYLYSRRLPADFDKPTSDRLFEVAKKGIEALGMRSTAAHVELIYNDTEVKLIEIGARIGGYRPRMYGYSYGLNLALQEARLAIGETPDLTGDLKSYSAVYELFPEKEGAFDTINNVADETIYTLFSIKAKAGSVIGPARNGYKAAAIIIVVQSDRQLFDSICRTVDTITIGTRP